MYGGKGQGCAFHSAQGSGDRQHSEGGGQWASLPIAGPGTHRVTVSGLEDQEQDLHVLMMAGDHQRGAGRGKGESHRSARGVILVGEGKAVLKGTTALGQGDWEAKKQDRACPSVGVNVLGMGQGRALVVGSAELGLEVVAPRSWKGPV